MHQHQRGKQVGLQLSTLQVYFIISFIRNLSESRILAAFRCPSAASGVLLTQRPFTMRMMQPAETHRITSQSAKPRQTARTRKWASTNGKQSELLW